MSLDFYPGQKIACIKIAHCFNDEICPKKGIVYTVREIFIDPYYKKPVVRLVEIVNKPRRYTIFGRIYECGYPLSCFTPVVDTKTETDISELKKIVEDVFEEKKHKQPICS